MQRYQVYVPYFKQTMSYSARRILFAFRLLTMKVLASQIPFNDQKLA